MGKILILLDVFYQEFLEKKTQNQPYNCIVACHMEMTKI